MSRSVVVHIAFFVCKLDMRCFEIYWLLYKTIPTSGTCISMYCYDWPVTCSALQNFNSDYLAGLTYDNDDNDNNDDDLHWIAEQIS